MSNSSFPATDLFPHLSSDEQPPMIHSTADPSSTGTDISEPAPCQAPSTEPSFFDNANTKTEPAEEPVTEARKLSSDPSSAVAREIQSKLSLSKSHSFDESVETPSTNPVNESPKYKEEDSQDYADADSESSFAEASEHLKDLKNSEDEKNEEIDPELSRRVALRERMAKMSGGLGMQAFGLPGMAAPSQIKSMKKSSEPESEHERQPINNPSKLDLNSNKPQESAVPSGRSITPEQGSPQPSTYTEEKSEPNIDEEISNSSQSTTLPGSVEHIPVTEDFKRQGKKEEPSPPSIITDFSRQSNPQVEEVLPLSQTPVIARLKPHHANNSSGGQSSTSAVDPAHAVRRVIDSIDPPKDTVGGTAADVESAANSPISPPRSLNSREQSPDGKYSSNNTDFTERRLPSRITEVSESQTSDVERAHSQRSAHRPSLTTLPSIKFNKMQTLANFNEELDDLPAVPRIFSPPPLPKTPSGEFGDSEFIQPKRQLNTTFIPGHQTKPSTASSLRNPVSISTSGGRPVLSDEPDEADTPEEPDSPDSFTEHPLPAVPVSADPVKEASGSTKYIHTQRKPSIIAPTPSVPATSPPPIPVFPINTEPKAPSVSPPPVPNVKSEESRYESSVSPSAPVPETNQNNSLTQDITQLGNSMRLPTRLVRPSSAGRKASGPRPVAPPSIPPPPPVSMSKSEVSKGPVLPAPTSSPPVPPPVHHQAPPAPSTVLPSVPPPTADVPPVPVSPFSSQDFKSSSSPSVSQISEPNNQEVSPTAMPQNSDSVSRNSISSMSIRQAPDVNPPPLVQRPSQRSMRSTASVKRPSIVATNGPFNDAYVAKIVDTCAEQKWWLDSSTVPNSVVNLDDSVLYMIREGTTGPNKHFKSVHILFYDYSQTVLTSTFNPATHYVTQLSQLQLAPPAQPSKERLAQEFECYGNTILRKAKASQGLTVGDGTAYAFVSSVLDNLTQNIEPINKRTFGAIVYANDSNVTIQQNGEIKAGDIVTFENVKLSGQKGTLRHKYAFEVGRPIHVGIVAEWEVSRMKIRALEQGRESKKVSLVSYKLGDLKSGKITVWRTMRRSWLSWT
ncbi:WIP family cytoskeletal protein Bbc1 [Schizosaccharomyces osmophilus]|uniref:WIP family cytoskeletal protein Bbc1 n=1 Tax=Schizosaccharomyces osmophilus TaxID=2545709 RepID=A0AAF0B052_9SCHI|nr:WIP family cytoskeletal protein Bbc1 [Schizosaccharomyces osmophilus]WBW75528.1 WIP family cytoskeletal protein Bbc1 [Schizosaccharomyces osmophilus]